MYQLGIIPGNHTNFELSHDSVNSLNSVKIIQGKLN